LLPLKKIFFKIECIHKKFPLTVKFALVNGSFEAFVSQHNPTPDADNYDLFFHTDSFAVDFKKNLDYIYMGITTKERLKTSIIVNFTEEEQEKKRKDYAAVIRDWQAKKEKSKKKKDRIYEHYHDEMTINEKLDLELMIDDIKKERKQKLIALAGNKNLVSQNRDIAKNYGMIKDAYLAHLVRVFTYF
jgi:hypothetical protein